MSGNKTASPGPVSPKSHLVIAGEPRNNEDISDKHADLIIRIAQSSNVLEDYATRMTEGYRTAARVQAAVLRL